MELTLDNLSKQYGSQPAVAQFSAVLHEGVHALLGSNGSGKTTLLRMICDVLKPTNGAILVDHTNISRMGEQYRELLGYLPQNFGYYPNFTGWDFMMYLAALKGLPKLTAKERCEELLQAFGLYDVRQKKIKTYSGGMRQRLGIAQALINDPSILILDEPTVGLDPKERAKFRTIIGNLSKDKIILLSTHIVSDIESMADNILMMKQGMLVLQGDADSICRKIDGMVWEGTVCPAKADRLMEQQIVSHLRRTNNCVDLRVVSDQQPFATAVPVEPHLEDLYLYYFQEEQTNEPDAL